MSKESVRDIIDDYATRMALQATGSSSLHSGNISQHKIDQCYKYVLSQLRRIDAGYKADYKADTCGGLYSGVYPAVHSASVYAGIRVLRVWERAYTNPSVNSDWDPLGAMCKDVLRRLPDELVGRSDH